MNKREVIKLVREISESITEQNGYELVDVEFVKEGPNHFLRIYIDKPGGITIDDCQIVSEAINKKLDEIDPIDVSYYLEVSSPGIDRPLKTDKDLNRNIGKDVEVKLYQNIEGKKKLIGELLFFDENIIRISDDELGEIEILKTNIAKINLAIRF
ncbi:ribosome maturation factor RimP [Anaerosalibacter sp. Marseille-P3206]|uniref:ribosome maturation factor RimP n=1 Tax=Anaerosalibacter sp. Marseille-P3206 TaxID=1871005 RepID=UPI0009859B5E|nr:ribosome maturation factor RimP [Anaerosalibacter sp. Marseille-P3206]